MGVSTTRTVFCDTKGCNGWRDTVYKKIVDIVKEFRTIGWRFKDGKFTCPECLKEGK